MYIYNRIEYFLEITKKISVSSAQTADLYNILFIDSVNSTYLQTALFDLSYQLDQIY